MTQKRKIENRWYWVHEKDNRLHGPYICEQDVSLSLQYDNGNLPWRSFAHYGYETGRIRIVCVPTDVTGALGFPANRSWTYDEGPSDPWAPKWLQETDDESEQADPRETERY